MNINDQVQFKSGLSGIAWEQADSVGSAVGTITAIEIRDGSVFINVLFEGIVEFVGLSPDLFDLISTPPSLPEPQ